MMRLFFAFAICPPAWVVAIIVVQWLTGAGS
jgi:hypothetical protein